MIRLLLAMLLADACFAAGGSYTLIGWNDLGMHCMDGDYSVYTILPPYNTIHAQLVGPSGNLVTTPVGMTVTYQAIADSTGSINTSSVGKTNFWQFVKSLFGAAVAPDAGLAGSGMPGSNNAPQTMRWEAANSWFTATGIPLTPFDDNRDKNYYPMMRITARDSAGAELAHTDIVLPLSDEMDCSTCHSSGSNPAAMPRRGWVNEPLAGRDFRLNVLLKHDDLHAGVPTYQSALQASGYNTQGLYATVVRDGKPVLCAACHASNALGTTGQFSTPPLTTSIHAFHAYQVDPVTGTTLDASTNRSACYRCHPGAETRCLRGAMGNAAAGDGTLAIQCQSCHGNMSAVGDASRQGWLSEPNCQNCHTGTAVWNSGEVRFTSALDASGAYRTAADQTFATQPNVPGPGLSLYRFSAGHGGLACEACHGSTHAEFPSSHANDNAQSVKLQGYSGFLGECSTCHPANSAAVGTANLTGPHGMHPVGQAWVNQHNDFAERSPTACQACHGADYKGSVLSRAFADRTLSAFGTQQFWRGAQIGCYSCHNGPGSETRNLTAQPSLTGGSIATNTGVPASLALTATAPNLDPLVLYVVSAPANGTAGINGSTVRFIPRPGFEGSDVFTVGAWDSITGLASNLATVQVQVTAATRPLPAALVNAASFLPGAIAPGEIVTFFGWGIGPSTPYPMYVNSAGLVNRGLAGARILFDGLAAPILYASGTQVNAIAPWRVAGKSTVEVRVEYGGIQSGPMTVNVAAAAPAIFPEAILNQDYSVNSPANGASKGSGLILFATGGGTMTSAAFDGAFTSEPYATFPAGAISVQVGGLDAQVTYAGDEPGSVSGLLRIGIQIPTAVASGAAVPLSLKVNGIDAPPVAVSIK
jgi:uncharacterized protein (TIGR03437 family)